jgi:hypothetical protein
MMPMGLPTCEAQTHLQVVAVAFDQIRHYLCGEFFGDVSEMSFLIAAAVEEAA